MEPSTIVAWVVGFVVSTVLVTWISTLIRFRDVFEQQLSHRSVIARWLALILSMLIALLTTEPIVALIIVVGVLYALTRIVGLMG